MQQLAFVSPNYAHSEPKNYRLSISIRRDGFSFMIRHKNSQEIVAYAYTISPADKMEESLRKLLSLKVLQGNFDSVSVIVVSFTFTTVPKKFYQDSMMEQYAKFNFERKDSDSILSYESKNSDSVVIFPINTSLWTLCRYAFKLQKKVSYLPQVAPLIELGAKQKPEKVSIMVENTFFTAVYTKGRDLKFCNSYKFRNVNDFMFYIGNMYEQLQLNPQMVSLEISGKMNEKSPYYKAMQVFVKNVSMATAEVNVPNFPYTLFHAHCNLALCE